MLTSLSTVLVQRFPLDIDLTSDKIYTMTEENVDFIKGVDRKVNIYVCLTEEEYACESDSSYNLAYYAATKNFVDRNSDNVSYYLQTVDLLEKYLPELPAGALPFSEACRLLLNGKELVLGENDELPCLCGKTVEGKLEIPATACAFVVL